jgi:hypothetical protein
MSFAEYVQAGWALCRIKPGTKGPSGDNWQLRESAIRDVDGAAALMSAGLCHAWSGTAALDIDNWDVAEKWLTEQGVNLQAYFDSPDAVQISSGRRGRGKLLFRLPTPMPTLKLAPYKAPGKKNPEKLETFHGLELRCATAGGLTVQDVLPPTIHPETGQPYEWVYGDPLLGHWSELPPLPAALEALWRAHTYTAPTAAEPAKDRRGATMAELQTLIAAEDPDDYENWIRIGQILHHETEGSAAGFQLWDKWSRQSDKYSDGKTRSQERWAGFGQNDGTGFAATVGSLVQSRVAQPEEFALTSEKPEEVGLDTRASTSIEAILKPRITYLLDQERFYHKPLLIGEAGFTPGLDTVGAMGLKPMAFDILYAPFMPIIEDTEGKPKVADPRQSVRRSKFIEKVNGVGFHPGAPRIFVEEDGNRYLNEYEPINVAPLRPNSRELDIWQFLCTRIEDPVFQSWLRKFYAFALAKPGVKIQAAPLLVSDTQGTGKTTWMQTIPQLLYGARWVREVSSDLLGKSFNAFLAGTWWVAIEELKTDGPRMDRIAIANKLKPWITSKTIPIEFKGLNAYQIVNRVQLTASSNFRDTLQLDNSDRRWGIGRVVERAWTEAEKQEVVKGFIDSPRAAGVLRWLIQQENLTGFSPTAAPPQTAEKTTMIQVGLGQWETHIAEMMLDGKPPFDRDIVGCEDIQEALRTANVHLSRKRAAMMLRKAPFNVVSKSTGTQVLYCWRNCSLWEHLSAANWSEHRDTGMRFDGAWTLKVPVAIRSAAGEDESPDEFSDLLGAI